MHSQYSPYTSLFSRFLVKIFLILNWDYFFFIFLGVGASFFGEILQPQGGVGGAAQGNSNGGTTVGGKLVSGDLDASLANLTSNLNLGGGTGFGK